ncbi:M23 family metallopeptidase [Deinococcus metallilatus]|uniref:M23 family metallopeptidase n=1 Tax=Deinococcus metallilatus TaxID=1211322 RepID=A0AAJ5F4U6_9DEIO|nr:M23 family metallopeptidase [Deinococcus metallilatus]MBB5294655.1 murein DD-endopeptidase MepM/ murein hydrolase activator NlpD [Deinococcus metallilatus]QBY07691.1 M23 family metallopeptidase [Deinococcus metallilatus]RXJ14107.1 M23 family metallopeptidase [Deinococcus metallilatus]TLK30072.1 M23 family metallopeptidase [Deinococcus metallilatus]GMA15869.1 peptidase M23 [Deinococcus metallilatus]
MRRLLRLLPVLALLVGAAYLLWPAVRKAQRYAALLAAPAPTARSLPTPLPDRHFADTWGGARSGERRHEGVDIFAPRGTPIHATTSGIVLNVGENRLGGRTVMILGPGGQRHYYAHLDRYADLQAGEWIEAGTVVGYVGDSGNARGTPTHLHYGIYTASGAINPYPLLRQEE